MSVFTVNRWNVRTVLLSAFSRSQNSGSNTSNSEIMNHLKKKKFCYTVLNVPEHSNQVNLTLPVPACAVRPEHVMMPRV